MYKATNEQISNAARRYLEARSYLIQDAFEHDGVPYVVAEDGDEVVLARVSCGYDGVPEPWGDRDGFEEVAAFYLDGRDDAGFQVRGDSIDIMVLSGARALLRHTINCSGSFDEA